MLIRTAAWIVAVPLLCATVIVGGAVPLYLLLPDAEPGVSAPATKPMSVAGARPAGSTAASKPPAGAAEPADEPPTTNAAAAVSDEVPAEAAEGLPPAEAADEPQIAAVIPTPRPEPPAPAAPEAVRSPAVDVDAGREEAALAPPAPGADEPQAVAPPPPQAGRRDTILRAVTLRSGPRGREVGTLKQGTPVVVGRCDGWCEVTADGASGWIHPSFLTRSGAAQRDGARATRQAERRRPARGRDADWLAEDERYGRYDDRMLGGPPAAYYEERPRVLRRRPPPEFYEYYD